MNGKWTLNSIRELIGWGNRAGLAGLFLMGLVAGNALAGEGHTDAHWIWLNTQRESSQEACLRKQFPLKEMPRRAQLFGVADFCRAVIYVNGHQVADVEPFGSRIDVDVTRHLVVGENILAIHATSVAGPSAVFAHLDLVDSRDNILAVTTDASWQAGSMPSDGWLQPEFTADSWMPATSLGRVAMDPWGAMADDIQISPFDDYTQWKQATGTRAGSDVASFRIQDGFAIEQLRLAADDEGSWVSMAFDPRGRLVIAREDRGLLRMVLPDQPTRPIQIESINDTLQECRGLLFAHGSLYVNANNSKALYKLSAADGSDQFGEPQILYASKGGVGHGRNDLALGPDGWIYTIHGDSVDMPRDVPDRTSPLREQRRGENSREGHVLRIAPDGSRVEIVAAGLRNPYGIDFNSQGEMFTYDADAEFDMGAPWYRPTRVVHLVSGADYGWRGVTGQWPPYYPDHPDNARPTLDIGKGSPTAVRVGTQSTFPPRYQQALFILDWAYGRIMAVHLEPRGAGYCGRAEMFLRGQPLNVTDLDFGPDGAMYFITGGRATQSALYRVRYTGPAIEPHQLTAQQQTRRLHADKSRSVRHELERLHGLPELASHATMDEAARKAALDGAWTYLNDSDPVLRYAARIAVEGQPLPSWRERALAEQRPMAAATLMMALARGRQADVCEQVLTRLVQLPIAKWADEPRRAALHAYWLCLRELREAKSMPSEALRREIVAQLLAMYPHASYALNQPLSGLLIQLDAEHAVGLTMERMRETNDPVERLHYLFVLRDARRGWTLDLRRAYLQALGDARTSWGGEGMPGFLRQIREDFLAGLDANEQQQLAALIHPPETATTDSEDMVEPRPLVQQWKLVDLLPDLARPAGGRDHRRGRELFDTALCSRCHRVRDQGKAVGPDLTAAGRRFSSRDLLLAILEPSKVVAENYRAARIVTQDGKTLVGRVVPGGDYRSPTLLLVTDPLRPDQVTTVLKSDIESYDWSALSPMPEGLLNTLQRDEILDLLAYIESGGDPTHPVFRRSSHPATR